MAIALPAAEPQQPRNPKKAQPTDKVRPGKKTGRSGGKRQKGKKSKKRRAPQGGKRGNGKRYQDQDRQSQGENQSQQQSQHQPPHQQEVYYDYDRLNEAAHEFAKTLAYQLGQHTRAQADEAAAKAVAEVKRQTDGTWIINCAFWIFITLIGASSSAIANLNILSMVPGTGLLTSATTAGAAGAVDVSQLDMSPATVGMSANGFPITSGYGKRTAPTAGASDNHTGVDVGAPANTPIYAPAAGKVVCSGSSEAKHTIWTNNIGGYGDQGVEFQSADPAVPDFFIGHNNTCIPGTVSPGDNIGGVGTKGVSTGYHAHIVQFGGVNQDVHPQIGFVSLIMGAEVPIIKGRGSTSGDLVSLVKEFESCHTTSYWDFAQYSVGYGTKSYPGETIDCGEGSEAERRLLAELDKARSQVRSVVTIPLLLYEEDALVSFQFNTGSIQNSDLLRQLNSGNKRAAAAEFDRWIHANGQRLPGLVDRRKEEKELFLKGDYSR